MSHNKLNESDEPSRKGQPETPSKADDPLNEGNPNHQDVKGRMGNFTGTGEPPRQVYSDKRSMKKGNASKKKK